MAANTQCVDHDRNLRFEHPADWTVSVESMGEGLPDALGVWSPAGPDGTGVFVGVTVDWHDLASLHAFVDRSLGFLAKSPGYVLHRRSAGRHPGSGLPAISVTCDSELNGVVRRKEMIFLDTSPGVVLSATASCPAASRHLWREGCKTIFASLNLVDPLRPPVPGSGGLIGVGLAPGHSDAVQRLWMLLDATAKQLVEINGQMIEEQTGLRLGAAAHFETRAYLLYELSLTMLGYRYPAENYRKVRRAIVHAITGRQPLDPPPPEGPLARLAERERLYTAAGGKQVAKERILSFAELLTTSGTENTPAEVDPAHILKRWPAPTPAKAVVFDTHLPLTMPFRFSLCCLFRDTPNIDALDVREVDRRFDAGHEAARKQTEG